MFKFPWPGCITRATRMAAVEAENAWFKVLLRAYCYIADVRQSTIADREFIIAEREATIAKREATIAKREATIAKFDSQNEELHKMTDQDWR